MNSKLMKQVVFVFLAIMMLSVVPAQADPYLELIGPDSVQLGHTATYTVTTVGGTDSSYTWRQSYSTNDSGTISQEGVLTTMNVGVFGLQVIGNDTGASASLHIEIVPNEYGGVAIAGPDEVAVGGKITLTATTGGVSSYWYSWLPENSSSEPWFSI